MAADLALYDLRSLPYAGGAVHDPVAALLMCAPTASTHTIVQGQVVVREGRLTTVDLRPVIETHNRLARQLVNGE